MKSPLIAGSVFLMGVMLATYPLINSEYSEVKESDSQVKMKKASAISKEEENVYQAIGEMHILSMLPEHRLLDIGISMTRVEINACMKNLLMAIKDDDFTNEKVKPCLIEY